MNGEELAGGVYGPLAALRYHVTGAIERGEAEPIYEVTATTLASDALAPRGEDGECEGLGW